MWLPVSRKDDAYGVYYRKVSQLMDGYKVATLILLSIQCLVALLTYIDKH